MSSITAMSLDESAEIKTAVSKQQSSTFVNVSFCFAPHIAERLKKCGNKFPMRLTATEERRVVSLHLLSFS